VEATRFSVNGTQHAVQADPKTPLLDVLRDVLHLKGTRFGCGAGECGACHVLVDGVSLAACNLPLWAVQGKALTTVEGLPPALVNPDGVRAQIEGGAIQATSWALKEAVRFDADGITSDAWERYPILRFSEVPVVDVHIVASDAPSVGAGEASLGLAAAAIGNALFDALNVRVRDLPLTAERIVAAMA
jgi:hypothetical protein